MTSQSFVANDSYFVTKNTNQEILFDKFWPLRSELENLSSKEIKSVASKDVEEVNGFLKKNNFDIQLEQIDDPKAFYVASILDVLLIWKEKGLLSSIYDAELHKNYSAVEMKNSDQWKVFAPKTCSDNCLDCKDKILEVTAKNCDKVYMKIAEKPLDGFDLMSKILELQDSLSLLNVDESYDKILFPMVAIDQRVDISWLKKLKLRFPGRDDFYGVAQALQQTKLKIDENGAVVKSAVAISWNHLKSMENFSLEFKIDKPFYLWVMRPGMTLPLVAAYVDKSSWKQSVNLK